MKGEKRQPTAATARHSLPNAEAANKRLPQPPSTPAATNKRSTRHSTTIQPLDTRQPKVRKTAQTPQLSSQRDEEHKEAEEDETSDASLSALCSLVNSLATLHSQSLSDHDIITSRYQSLLSALHRLSPPTSLSPRHPPSSAVSTAVRSAAEELITVARALQTTIPSSPLLHSQLLQLHSALLPLPASDVYALLLSSSVTLCQLLARSSTSRSSRLQADGATEGQLSGRYVEHVTGLFGTELDALRKEGESSVGAACLPLLAQSVQHIITAHLPNDTSVRDSARTLLLADLQQRVVT